jgi:hypothetical protein
VAASVTTVVTDSVEMLVSCTTTVTTVVYVVVVVEGAAVAVPTVTVVGCGFRQLHALESLEAGCRSKFFLVRSTQLGVALETGVDTSRRWAPPPVVTVAVTVSYATSVAVVVEVVSTVVILLAGMSDTQRCTDPRGWPTYTTSMEVEVVVEVSITVSVMTGVSVLTWTVMGSMER